MVGFTIRRFRSLLILLVDVIAFVAVFSGFYQLRLNELPDYTHFDLWLILLTMIGVLFISGTYFRETEPPQPRLPLKPFFVCLSGGLLCVVWVYLLGPTQFNNYFGRGILPLGSICFGIVATISRALINRLHYHQETNTDLLYVGYSDDSDSFLSELKNHDEVRSVAFVSDEVVPSNSAKIESFSASMLDQLLNRRWHGIILDPNHKASDSEVKKLIELRLSGIPVYSLADYYEHHWFMVPVQHIRDKWFLSSQGFSMQANPVSLRVKRSLDVLLALLLLTVTFPLIVLCGIMIKLTSRGPMLYNQERVGVQGKPFIIHKLRTMRQDSEPKGPQWAATNDPRITLIGNLLRTSRLDELPQTWNVLKGEMSFIGPRPERPEFTEKLAQQIPYYDLRHMVKPGISGWAQVVFPYGASAEDALKKLQYELYYIKHQSLLFDLNIMVRTIFTVFQRAGR